MRKVEVSAFAALINLEQVLLPPLAPLWLLGMALLLKKGRLLLPAMSMLWGSPPGIEGWSWVRLPLLVLNSWPWPWGFSMLLTHKDVTPSLSLLTLLVLLTCY
jgi:hypothetical protein